MGFVGVTIIFAIERLDSPFDLLHSKPQQATADTHTHKKRIYSNLKARIDDDKTEKKLPFDGRRCVQN